MADGIEQKTGVITGWDNADPLGLSCPNVPALLFGLAEALAPFVAAYAALPTDIRANPDRNLADVLGVFAPERPLTVGALAELAAAAAIVGAP